MNKDFEASLKELAEHLLTLMGENKAIHWMNKFVQIPAGNAVRSIVDMLILHACQEYGISKEMFFHSTKLLHCYARITCFHIVKKHIQLPTTQIAKLFLKKKRDSVIDGIERCQGLLDIPQYNRDFVAKYKSIEQHYMNFTKSLSYEPSRESNTSDRSSK